MPDWWGRPTQLDRIESNLVTVAKNQVLLGQKLDTLLTYSKQGIMDMSHLQETINSIKTEVSELRTVNQGARTLLEKLFTMVEQHIDDPDELREVLTSLRAEKEEMVASVTKNTPAEQEQPNPPAPETEVNPENSSRNRR